MDTSNVKRNINEIYRRKEAALYAIALFTVQEMLQQFRAEQAGSAYWQNQSNDAKNRMFTDARITSQFVSLIMAHGVDYGVYLELANNGQNAAIRLFIELYEPIFIKRIKELYGD